MFGEMNSTGWFLMLLVLAGMSLSGSLNTPRVWLRPASMGITAGIIAYLVSEIISEIGYLKVSYVTLLVCYVVFVLIFARTLEIQNVERKGRGRLYSLFVIAGTCTYLISMVSVYNDSPVTITYIVMVAFAYIVYECSIVAFRCTIQSLENAVKSLIMS